MNLDDLTPLKKYNEEQRLTYREALTKALAGKIEIYYVFDTSAVVTYRLKDIPINDDDTDEALPDDTNCIETEYDVLDTILLTDEHIRGFWRAESSDGFKLYYDDKHLEQVLFFESAPEGYVTNFYSRESEDGSIKDNLFVNLKPSTSNSAGKMSDKRQEKPSTTALKVIGLLMHHLAKSPKYASGSSPNKSQIKELLLDLAEELGVNNYGLSKVDERLLAEAMKYLETQKN